MLSVCLFKKYVYYLTKNNLHESVEIRNEGLGFFFFASEAKAFDVNGRGTLDEGRSGRDTA